MERDNWTNAIINSTDGMQKAAPGETLFLRIQHKIRNRETVPAKWLWTAAASFLLLLALNFNLVANRHEKNQNPAVAIAAGISQNNQLY